MQVETVIFGSVEVTEDEIFHMPVGPFGFENTKDYALIEMHDDEEDVTLRWLQAVDDTVPCFVVFDPFDIVLDYDPIVERHDLSALGCSSQSDLNYFVIAVIPQDHSMATVNLKSPIVVNKKNRQASQVILNNDYPVRFSLSGSSSKEG